MVSYDERVEENPDYKTEDEEDSEEVVQKNIPVVSLSEYDIFSCSVVQQKRFPENSHVIFSVKLDS